MPMSSWEEEVSCPAGKQIEEESISFWVSQLTSRDSMSQPKTSSLVNFGITREILLLGLPPFSISFFIKTRVRPNTSFTAHLLMGPSGSFRHTLQTNLSRYQAYQQIKGASAELAEASLSLIPGTSGDPTSSTSSLSSDILISQIQNSAVKRVQNGWAEAFARAKEIVTTDYSVNYVPCNSVVFIHQQNQKNYIHAIIEPHGLSMSQFEQKVTAPVKLNVVISDRSGQIIHQEEKNVQIEVSQEDFKKIQRRLSDIGDVIPLVEGDFYLRLLLRNLESKEFSSLEENISSPIPGKPSLSPLLLLNGEKEVPGVVDTIPFLSTGTSSIRTRKKIIPLIKISFFIWKSTILLQNSTPALFHAPSASTKKSWRLRRTVCMIEPFS